MSRVRNHKVTKPTPMMMKTLMITLRAIIFEKEINFKRETMTKMKICMEKSLLCQKTP
jgi:hypothetical protein